jgi:hypothetical protein
VSNEPTEPSELAGEGSNRSNGESAPAGPFTEPEAQQQPDDDRGRPSGFWHSDRAWRGRLAVFTTGGLVAALGLFFAAGSFFLDLRAQGDELEAAEIEAEATKLALSPIAEYIYWLGPPSEELAGADAAASLPEEFRSFRVVQTPGPWTTTEPTKLVDELDIKCETSTCHSTIGSPQNIDAAHRVVWLVLINAGSTPMQSLAFEWAEVDTSPVESDDPFDVVRNPGITEGEPEGLIDLGSGGGIIVPLASVLRVPALGTINTVPLGEARLPVALRFTMIGEPEEQRVGVREPADVLVTGGFELDNGEVFEGGG